MDQDDFFSLLQPVEIKQEAVEKPPKPARSKTPAHVRRREARYQQRYRQQKMLEKREERLEKVRIAAQIRRQNETPEQREERLRKDRERMREYRSKEYEAQAAFEAEQSSSSRQSVRERRLFKDRIKRQNETPEERAERLRKRNERERELRQNESPAAQRARLEKRRERDRNLRWNDNGGIKYNQSEDDTVTINLKFCRFCLAKMGRFESHDIPKSYFNIFKAYFGSEFVNNRNYPKKICTSCSNKFKEVTAFLETVNEAQSTVTTLVKEEIARVKERELEKVQEEIVIDNEWLMSFQHDPISLKIPIKSEAHTSFDNDDFPPLDDDNDDYEIPEVDVKIDVKGTFPLLPCPLEEKEIPIKVEETGNHTQVFTSSIPIPSSVEKPKSRRSRATFVPARKTEGFTAPLSYRKKKGVRSCDICGFTYNSYGGISYHIRHEHIQKGLPTHQPFKCNECDLTFTSNYLRWRHKSQAHYDQSQYSCKICDKQFENAMQIYTHNRKRHSQKMICNVCANFFDPLELHKHVRRIHTVHDCKYCGEKFEGYERRDRHVKKFHETTLKCPECKTVWNDLAQLKQHMKTFHEEKEMVCMVEGCTYATKLRPSLKCHLTRHKDIDEMLKQQLLAEIDLFQVTRGFMQHQ